MTAGDLIVTVAAVPFSANLGDGVIGECLRWGLEQQGGVKVNFIDIAGRRGYGEESEGSSRLKAVFSKSPPLVQQAFAFTYFGVLKRTALRRQFEAVLANSDALVVGGGNIISDVALNFPTKIEILSDAACRAGRATSDRSLPCALYSVGIADKWSKAGTALIGRAFARLAPVHATARDAESMAIGRRRFARIAANLTETWDPGVLAGLVWPRAQRPAGRARVGLGVISATSIKLDANCGGGLQPLELDDYLEVARSLVAEEFDVTVFCNGAREDLDLLDQLAAALQPSDRPAITVAPAPAVPADLVATIAGCDVIVANRLHAVIVAHAHGIPTVALEWDPKVRAFMDKTGRAAFSLPPGHQQRATILARALEAHTTGVSPAAIETMRAQALTDIAALVSALAPGRALRA